jgi:hypothetical protein
MWPENVVYLPFGWNFLAVWRVKMIDGNPNERKVLGGFFLSGIVLDFRPFPSTSGGFWHENMDGNPVIGGEFRRPRDVPRKGLASR